MKDNFQVTESGEILFNTAQTANDFFYMQSTSSLICMWTPSALQRVTNQVVNTKPGGQIQLERSSSAAHLQAWSFSDTYMNQL
mmetsp:Transcript_6426/g.18540  ORF Transcript_6426/g.18540 Transcript_6426/m.18540 type:complete len:83 (+) Transcript_6426:130-378(+)